MRRFATTSAVLLGLATAGMAATLVAPERTHAAGLDFWNATDDAARLRAAVAQGQDLEFESERMRQRIAVGDRAALDWCEDRIGLREALDTVAALAETSPTWFARLSTHYRNGLIPPSATDRDVMTMYFRVRLAELMRSAEFLGDAPRATFLSTRLARFDSEVQQAPALSALQSNR